MHKSAYPRIADPDHATEDDAGKVWAPGDAIGIVGFVEEDTGHDLRR